MPSQQRSIVRRAWVATGLVLLCLALVDPPRAEAQPPADVAARTQLALLPDP